ncbi:hypothetical protein AVEN_20212-1 [Araneus ventricosus]|uniref:Uncharacterized protein n=1 Tax=Araneus ventricosus TaxID=182803 RepID=A0A4Y2CK23_ARAVE|nr:hypothetical protein AVEN_20212-1 [Araneus ventricosus]
MIEARRISTDGKPALNSNLLNKQQILSVKMKDLYPGCFSSCIYENLWYFGMVNAEEEDITVKVLHPHGPSQFFCPNREDVFAVPIPHVIESWNPKKQ